MQRQTSLFPPCCYRTMRQPNLLFLLLLLAAADHLCAQPLLPLVNPFIGTANSTTTAALRHSAGTEQLANTLPAIGLPFGMTQWTPQTSATEQKCIAPYYYKDSLFKGIRGSHWISGSCMQDYGSVTLLPFRGALRTSIHAVAQPYSHQEETATPACYRLRLPGQQLQLQLTATARCALLQLNLQGKEDLHLLVLPNSDRGKGYIHYNAATKEIEGYNPAYRIYQGSGLPAGLSGYFVVQFSVAPAQLGLFNTAGVQQAAGDSLACEPGIGAYASFIAGRPASLCIRIGTSFTSIAAARRNLQAEISGWNFARLRDRNAAVWEKALTKIQVQKGDRLHRSVFYTALYHSMQHPRLMNDADGTYPVFASNYQTAPVFKGNYYDDFSMWDIYRAQLPLLEILDPERVNDFVRSLVRKGQQGGWLPIFPCWNNYTAAMIGDHAIAFMASAIGKGITGGDAEAAYRLMRKNAFEQPPRAEYLQGKGRRALDTYLAYGYVPLEDSVPNAFHQKEQVSRTLEYAWDDYSLATLARRLGKHQDYRLLLQRAHNYRNVFDTALQLSNGRYANGSWYAPYAADRKLFFITEGTPRQYTFYVPQDVPGLARLMGGRRQLEAALDTLFAKGEYWHGNEPGHHIPFLYNFTASPWKTQRAVQAIREAEYGNGPGGLSGNDDAGQLSAWYVFAAMGLYPVNPVAGEYQLCVPLFDAFQLQLPGGRQLFVRVHRNTPQARYIRQVKRNGRRYAFNYLTHANLLQGGSLDLYLQQAPAAWGSLPAHQAGGLANGDEP